MCGNLHFSEFPHPGKFTFSSVYPHEVIHILLCISSPFPLCINNYGKYGINPQIFAVASDLFSKNMIRTSFIRYNPRIIPREFDFKGPFKPLYLDLFNEYAISGYCV